jgi:hypothetical protein
MELLDNLKLLAELEQEAHRLGLEWEASWDALEEVCRARPAILAEVAILEQASVSDLVRFLTCDSEMRESVIQRVLCAGGLFNREGKWVEVGA